MIGLLFAAAWAQDAPACPEGTFLADDGTCIQDDSLLPCPEGTFRDEDGLCVKEGETIEVKASQLDESKDPFDHAGGRTVVDEEAIRESAATGIGEALRGVPGLKVVEASGTGNTDTKLNISVRGLNPRLSARSTILLDEIPLALAPYGQPQMSLFPLSPFSVHAVDVVRGGGSVRFGPQNVGGVINLRTRPVPETASVAGLVQTDAWGDTLAGLQAGGRSGPLGVQAEYTARGGESYREESRKEVHAGLLKLTLEPGRWRFTSTSHAYYEESELPGGLFPDAYAEDRRQSLRPLDGFSGRRVGSSVSGIYQPHDDLQLQVIGYGTLSWRQYRLADRPLPEAAYVFTKPRAYQVAGVEPRSAFRLYTGPASQEIAVGYRRAYEQAHYEEYTLDRFTGAETLDMDDDAQLAADAAYVEDEISFFEDRLRLNGGVRYENVRLARRDNLRQQLMQSGYSAWLPAGSLHISPRPEWALFGSYARSFGSPQFLQVVLAGDESKLTAEVADTFEVGGRLRDLGGFEAELTGFHMRFQDQIEFGETTFENIGETLHRGVEGSLYFWPGWYSEALDGLELEVGDTLLFSEIEAGLYAGNEMPYAPRHSLWWDVGWTLPADVRVAVDGWWEAAQFSDSANAVAETATGGAGEIPAFMVWNLRMAWEHALAEHWASDVRVGVKNVFDEDYWYRSDDINEGILPSRGRTLYASLGARWVK